MIDKFSQNIVLTSSEFEKERNYWLNNLNDEIELARFPYDFAHEINKGYHRGIIEEACSTQVFGKLTAMTNGSDQGLFILLLSGIVYLLNKYTGISESLVAMPVLKHSQNDTALFNSFLPLKTKLFFEESLKAYVSGLKNTVFDAIAHQNFPVLKALEMTGLSTINSGWEVIPTIVLLDSIHDPNCMNDLHSDIVFSFEKSNILNIKMIYNSTMYRQETMERILNHLIHYLKFIVLNTQAKLSDIHIMDVEEELLLARFNQTEIEYISEETIHGLFEQQVEKTPEGIAVVYKQENITYDQLNKRANRLARKLRGRGVMPGKVVGIIAERSFDMIVGLLAVLKAGGAYMPIDPEYPEERVGYMLDDSGVGFSLVQSVFADHLSAFSGIIVLIDEADEQVDDDSNLGCVNHPLDPAYVIYTSGTTGRPKGVLIEHAAILNSILWRHQEYKLNETDTVLQLFSYAFDGFLTSLFTPIVSGAKVVIVGQQDSTNPMQLRNLICQYRVTHFIIVPALLAVLVDSLSREEAQTLKIVTVAGEKISASLVEKCKSLYPHVEMVNEYGPTETSVVATCLRNLDIHNVESIGKPIANTKIYIIGAGDCLQPIGVVGELYISGAGLARGYMNLPELNSERFVELPFISDERVYKTGDLARWLPDGTIEYLGRVDDQVKIRGFRIELGEIEKQLLTHPSVKEAVMVVRGGEHEYLCAYMKVDETLTVIEIREHLLQRLPNFMVPSHFIRVNEWPLTVNGKINKRALPDPSEDNLLGAEFIPPNNDTEEQLLNIWKSKLPINRIGILDNFFEIGGNSLLLMQMYTEIERIFPGRIAVTDLFAYPTITKLSEYIQRASDHQMCEEKLDKLTNTEEEISDILSQYLKGKMDINEGISRLMN